MDQRSSFGHLVGRRRKALNLTQNDLARRVGCSVVTIEKIEADEQRPSREIAERLAEQLQLAPTEHMTFVQFARVGLDAAPARSILASPQLPERPPPAHLDFIIAEPPLVTTHAERPSGTVTFLFTDIEGSTRLWECFPAFMPAAFCRQEAILRQAIGAHGGYAYKMVGDAFQAAFATAPAALAAALAAQHALNAEEWGPIGTLRVRMVLDSGVVEERGDDYVGPMLNRTARLLGVGHGGQILLSAAARELMSNQFPAGVNLRDLGSHHLKDITRPERVFQVVALDLPADFPPLRCARVEQHNLPAVLTSFVGRTREMATIAAMLAESRLLTLAGPGGTGKTRLALQLAATAIDRFTHGVWMVELAPLVDPALLAQALAAVLGVREESGRPLLTTLTAHLRDKQMLLLLDNCEHLLDASADLANTLLHAAPQLHILTTSREPLGIGGEAVFRVPALAAPDLRKLPALSSLMQYEAVQLFVERARAAQPAFTAGHTNAAALAQVCARLDGIPLAIELAAARVRVLTVEQVAARLDDCFRLLTGGSRTALPRQRTLQALIDWSYDLLKEDERVLLGRLAVFLGGWTLEAAEAVCEGGVVGDVLDALTRLVDKSLVQAEAEDGAARYRMLETIRRYALDKLALSDEMDEVRRRHAAYYLVQGQDQVPWTGDITQEWLARVDREHDNLRAALTWSQTTAGDPDIALQLLFPLGHFWFMRGIRSELVQELERTLRHPLGVVHTRAYAQVRILLGDVYGMAGDYAAAQTEFEEGLAVSRQLGDTAQCAYALHKLGWLAREQGDAATAWRWLEESVAIYRALGDAPNTARTLTTLAEVAVLQEDGVRAEALLEESWKVDWEDDDDHWTAWVLNHFGHAAQLRGAYQRAAQFHAQSLALFLAFGEQDFGLPWAYQSLGETALAQEQLDSATAWFVKGIAMSRELDDRANLSWCLAGLGKVAAIDGWPARAARLWGAAEALRQSFGARPAPAARATYERALAIARANLDDPAFATAWQQGQTMPLEQLIAVALSAGDEL